MSEPSRRIEELAGTPFEAAYNQAQQRYGNEYLQQRTAETRPDTRGFEERLSTETDLRRSFARFLLQEEGGAAVTSLYSERLSASEPAGTSPGAEEDALSCDPTDPAPLTRVVVRGDTLWDIAKDELGDGRRYEEIYDANRETIGGDPDLIRPGQQLVIPGGSEVCPTAEPEVEPPPRVLQSVCTEFGDYDIVAADAMGPLAQDEVTQAQFDALEVAWRQVQDNSGGLQLVGSDADLATYRGMLGREMGNSRTFRETIVSITSDTAHPVTCNVGRDNAYWVDAFATNNVDLNDIEWFEEDPPAAYPWVQTQGEIILHFLVERQYHAVNGGDFTAAHNEPLGADGDQAHYRQDRGQPGYIVSQVRVDGGDPNRHEGVYTDDAGNQMIIRRDQSSGQPVPYEVEYRPAVPTPEAPGTTRTTPP